MTTDLRYPIGKMVEQKYNGEEPYSEEVKQQHLRAIRDLPQLLEYAIQNLDEAALNTAYRPEGWTIQQLVHHVADSHMNAYIRFKLGLTEDNPTIKPYNQDAWALLADTANVPVNVSLTLLHALHRRLYELLKSIPEQDWQRTVYHPEQKRNITLWKLLATYAWHGKHHTAQITGSEAAKRK